MEALIPLIYHERQERGSMMCAQHALNALLQENYFTAPDLSHIARDLDILEESYRETESSRSMKSRNMDDTGFFSVQVLEKALQVWDLSLVGWRSEQMEPYHDEPDTQRAFILNLDQHWFAIRRFGKPYPSQGHWFNLNSANEAPQWVGKMFLGMVLQQAEAEGYTVFSIISARDSGELTLPLCEADALASTLPEPKSAPPSNIRTSGRSGSSTSRAEVKSPIIPEGLEDEDLELQRALQASMEGVDYQSHVASPLSFPPTTSLSSFGSKHDEHVKRSTERNQATLQRFVAEQQAALEEGFEDLITRTAPAPRAPQRSHGSDSQRMPQSQSDQERSGSRTRGARIREPELDNQDEDLRRAIEESLQMSQGVSAESAVRVDDDDDDVMFVDADDGQAASSSQSSSNAQSQPRSRTFQEAGRQLTEVTPRDSQIAPPISTSPPMDDVHYLPPHLQHRVLDDEDADLQAALRASLEDTPTGYQHAIVDEPPRRTRDSTVEPAAQFSGYTQGAEYMDETTNDDDEVRTESSAPTSPEKVSVEEMRARRLARFGG